MNTFANQVHERLYGYNPYLFEIAKMVREGVMMRWEGLGRFSESPPISQINLFKVRLGL